MNVQDALAGLRGVRQSGAGWTARCPTHDDSHNSLSVAESADGKLLLNCHANAGCTYHGILAALAPSTSGNGARHIVAVYDYLTEGGALLCQSVRYEPKDFRQRRPDGAGGYVWNLKGVRRVLYRLPELLESDKQATVFIVEGEKDVDRLASFGLTATTNIGGAGKWRAEYNEPLRGHHVCILPDNDDAGAKHAAEVAASLHGTAASVKVAHLPNLPPKGDVSDYLSAGGTRDELMRFVERAAEWQPSSETGAQSSGEKSTAKQSQAARLVALASTVDFFHTPEGKTFARVPVASHIETVSVKSGAFRDWLIREYRRAEGTSPYTQALQTALDDLHSSARYDAPRYEIHTRIAEHEGAIYVDLCNDAWQAVRVTSEGWSIIESKDLPVSFRRTRGMLSLPMPETGGRLSDLQRFINVRAEDWPLVAAWLVAAFRPNNPFPVLTLHGEQGSAKSTTARILRALIDPNKAALRSVQRDERELMIAATNSWMIALDNLSSLKGWFSDALCRLATGGGFAVRENYSDDEEVLFDAMRPVILNGIEELATRSDLLDRAIIINLPTITEENRREQAEVWSEFERVRPRLFGACLSAVSLALRNFPETQLERKPRMADFARFAVAAESAFDCEAGAFLDTYTKNRTAANELALEAAPVAPVVLSFVEEVETWRGTASELLKALNTRAGDVASMEGWVKSPCTLSGALKRLAPNLRACGVEVTHEPRKNKARIIVLEKRRNLSSPSSLRHQTPDLQGETGDDAGDANGESDARRNLSPLENASKNGLSDDGDASDDDLHSFSKSARSEEEPLTEDETELAARLEYMENVPRKEAERRAREWFAPVPF